MNKEYFLYQLKSKLWIGITFIIFLLLTFAIIVSLIVPTFTDQYFRDYSYYYLFFSTLLYAGFTFIGTLIVFSYFDKKQKVDFYHSLPLKRKTLLISNYFVIPVLLTIPYIIFNVVYFIFIRYSMFNYVTDPNMLVFNLNNYNLIIFMFFKIILSSLFFYSIMVYLSTKTGKVIAHAFATAVAIFCPLILLIFSTELLYFTVNEGISSMNFFNKFFNFFVYEGGEILSTEQILSIITLIALIIAMFFINSKSYENFKSENTDCFFISNRLNGFFAILASLTISSLILMFVTVIGYESSKPLTFSFIVFLIFAILAFAIFISIFNQSISIENVKTPAFYTLISLVFLYSFVFIFDGTNIAGRIPNPNDVENVIVNDYQVSIKDINKVMEIHKEVLETSTRTNEFNQDFYNLDFNHQEVSFTYLLDNGKAIMRRYYLPPDSTIYSELTEIFTSDNYKETYINYLEMRKDSVDIYTLPNIYAFGKDIVVPTISDANRLYDALIEDIKADENFGLYNYDALNLVRINFTYSKDTVYYSNNYTLPININYTNTMKVIDDIYKNNYGSNANMLDNYELAVFEQPQLTQRLEIFKENGCQYLNIPLYLINNYSYPSSPNSIIEEQNIMDTATIYSYDNNKEEFLELISSESFYNSPNNSVMPTEDGDTVKTILNKDGMFQQYYID